MFRTFREPFKLARTSWLVRWVTAVAIAALEFQAIYTVLLEWE
ncbi:MAG TPA: hypothetical protein VEV17_23340 [Bryobacteraceae bacterium]|nr:hypothetical protein [Bryobacteraceae bacterium]